MKLLVASVGNRLDSFVAKRFEHAAWYLIVDEQGRISHAVHHLSPRDRHAVLLKAVEEQVEGIVAGRFGESTVKQIRAHKLEVAQLHGISVQSVLDRMQSHDIHFFSVDEMETGKGVVTGTLPNPGPKGSSSRSSFATAGFNSDSLRGHHHLQQYGGRGH